MPEFVVNASNLKEGLCLVCAPHATASIIMSENRGTNVCKYISPSLSCMVPKRADCEQEQHRRVAVGLVGR